MRRVNKLARHEENRHLNNNYVDLLWLKKGRKEDPKLKAECIAALKKGWRRIRCDKMEYPEEYFQNTSLNSKKRNKKFYNEPIT